MSRAFAKENDLEHLGIDIPERLLSGEPNYVTPNGLILLNKKIEVLVKPNTRIAYWSSIQKDSTNIPDVVSAYDDFSNSGVVVSDNNGIAILSVKLGTDYIVPGNKLIKRHVHYRELDLEYGMMGEVQTVYY